MRYQKLTCSSCPSEKLVDFLQEEPDVIGADSTIKCKNGNDHIWKWETECPECEKIFHCPVDQDGEPQWANCGECEKQQLLN